MQMRMILIFITTSTEKSLRTIFHHHYEEKITTAEVRAQVTSDVDQIMQYDNAIDHLLTML